MYLTTQHSETPARGLLYFHSCPEKMEIPARTKTFVLTKNVLKCTLQGLGSAISGNLGGTFSSLEVLLANRLRMSA